MKDIVLKPIGVIRSPHTKPEDTPIQPVFAEGVPGRVELHRAREARLSVTPYISDTERGVFATRSPRRPNGLGMSLVRLVRREGTVLHIEDVDVLDGTPLLDIKPYIGRYDCREDARSGWQDDVDDETARRRGRRGFTGTEQ
jgi:tRNA (Thr-GGU) A37 N-methylase